MKRLNWMKKSNDSVKALGVKALGAKTLPMALGLVLVTSLVYPSVAQAEMPSWWPGSGGEESTAQAPTTAPAVTPANAPPAGQAPVASADPMVDSPLFDISWPKVEMPKLNWKPSWGKKEPGAAVAKKDNPVSGALEKVSTASKDAANGVRNAWGSAMSMLSPAEKPATGNQVATKQEPGFWSRMFGPQPEPQGSQTVTEFLAQDRPGTTTR